jgi:hypothetical protein
MSNLRLQPTDEQKLEEEPQPREHRHVNQALSRTEPLEPLTPERPVIFEETLAHGCGADRRQ